MPDDTGSLGSTWERVQAWLQARDFRPLCIVMESMASTKAAEMIVGARAYNHFPYGEFAAFVQSLPWEYSENVVLVIQPQEGSTGVFRPN